MSSTDVIFFVRSSSLSCRTVAKATESSIETETPARLGAGPSFAGLRTVSSFIPAGTGSKISDGATLLGRLSLRISTTSSRWLTRPSIINWRCSAVKLTPAMTAACSMISGVFFANSGMDSETEDCASAEAVTSASKAPGRRVLPRPAAVETARKRRRVASRAEGIRGLLHRAVGVHEKRPPLMGGLLCAMERAK